MRFMGREITVRRKTARIAAGLVLLACVYILFGFFGVGPLVRSSLEKRLTEALNRQVRVEDVRFNPLTFRTRIFGFSVKKKEGEGKLASFRLLDIRPHAASVITFAPVIAKLRLEAPAVDVAMLGAGEFSISDIFRRGEKGGSPGSGGDDLFPFRIENVEIVDGELTFRDLPRKTVHSVTQLNLAVPFTSSLEKDREKDVRPTLSAMVNGRPFELDGRTRPFDESRRTELEFTLKGVNLPDYWQYLPVDTPLALRSGMLDLSVTLGLRRAGEGDLRLNVSGRAESRGLELVGPEGDRVAAAGSVALEIGRFSLSDDILSVSSVRVNDPFVAMERREDGGFDWQDWFPAGESAEPAPAEGSVSEALPERADEADVSAGTESGGGLIYEVASAEVSGGRLLFRDRAVPGGFERELSGLRLSLSSLTSRPGGNFSFTAEAAGAGSLSASGNGTLTPLSAQAELSLSGVPVRDFIPYLHPYLAEAEGSGDDFGPLILDSATAGADLRLEYSDTLRLENVSASLADAALRKPGNRTPSITVGEVALSGGSVDTAARSASVGQVRIVSPYVRLIRYPEGLDLPAMFSSEKPGSAVQTGDGGQKDSTGAEWNATVGSVTVEDGTLELLDRALSDPARTLISGITFEADNPGTDLAQPVPFRAGMTFNGEGRTDIAGTITPQPLAVETQVSLRGTALSPFGAYLAEYAGLEIGGGSFGADIRGSLLPDAGEFQAEGSFSLAELVLESREGRPLGGLKGLAVKDFSLSTADRALTAGEVRLDAPEVQIAVDESGLLNWKAALNSAPARRRGGGADEDTPAADSSGKEGAEDSQTAADGGEETLFRTIRVDRIVLDDGTVGIRDASVSPAYTSSLEGLTVRLGGAALDPSVRPEFSASGKLDGHGLSVEGSLNPLARPLYSDLKVKLDGLDLVSLTPYTLRHLAYPVEKGRLYADIRLHTEDNVLDARNRFFVEQIALGEKDASPDAPSVPVQLGLALLQDPAGNLTVNLPVKGRLDDPDFRVGGIVFRAFVNLLFKAVASPFTLIANIVGGGGEDLRFVTFDPGSAVLGESATVKLADLAEAFAQRPKLSLEIRGYTDEDADTRGIVEREFQRMLREAKYSSMPRRERADTSAEAVTVSQEEYAEVLAEAYATVPVTDPATSPERPENFLGIVTEQPVEYMESFLKAQVRVTPDTLSELATSRAQAVQAKLLELQPDLVSRLFLASTGEAPEERDGIPATRVELGIR